MKVTILGCSGSGGVPMIGPVWGACNPDNPKNRRTRPSILVEEGETRLLVDCGPDLREQFLRNGVSTISATLMTHAHADHLLGIDDLRRLYWLNGNVPLPFYADQATMDEVKQRFTYAFRPFRYGADSKEPFVCHILTPGQAVQFGSIRVVPFMQQHGSTFSLGLRFNDFAYSTDVSHLDEVAFAALDGITHWLVDCERYETHHAHSWFEQTLGWIQRVRPQQAWLTHMNVHLDYDELLSRCPPGVEPAYDGLAINI